MSLRLSSPGRCCLLCQRCGIYYDRTRPVDDTLQHAAGSRDVCERAPARGVWYLFKSRTEQRFLLLLLLVYGTTTVVSNAQCRTVPIPFETERTIVYAFECFSLLCVRRLRITTSEGREREDCCSHRQTNGSSVPDGGKTKGERRLPLRHYGNVQIVSGYMECLLATLLPAPNPNMASCHVLVIERNIVFVAIICVNLF